MGNVPDDNALVESQIRAKIRLDYKAERRPGKFWFGSKNIEEVAEEAREQKVALLRNVPVQGMHIEEIDMSSDVYVVQDDLSGNNLAYAPVQITVTADSVEALGKFIVAEEFRKIELLEPENIKFSRQDLERMLFKLSQDIKSYTGQIERKYMLR